MERLIHKTNGLLYRRNNLLVRTPISNVKLNPIDMAYYSIAGSYNSSHFPDRGFHGMLTQADVIGVGQQVYNGYFQTLSNYQIWRQVSTSHHPETAWYQGSYATSAPNPPNSCESYGQVSGYKFTVPSGLNIATASLTYTLGGLIVCRGSATGGSNDNTIGGLTSQEIGFIFTNELKNPISGYDSSTTVLLDNISTRSSSFSSSYNPRGKRDLWGFTASSGRDGWIPALVNSSSQQPVVSLTVPTNCINYANTQREFWIVGMYGTLPRSGESYAPYYVPSNVGYWCCLSFWDIGLTVSYTAQN